MVAPLSREIESKLTTWVSTIIAVDFLMITEWLFFALVLCLAAAASPYRESLPSYGYQFPRDHFEYPDFRTEWWYYTGNVHTTGGDLFGFELVFFRQGERRGPSENRSA